MMMKLIKFSKTVCVQNLTIWVRSLLTMLGPFASSFAICASRLALWAFSCSRMKRSSSVEPALQNRLEARRVDGVMWTPRRTLAVERLLDASEAARRKARAALQGPCEEHACVLSTCEQRCR